MCSNGVPALHEYLAVRKSTNFTEDKFNAEPYDKRHEEFNKPGLNMFNIRNVDDFQKAFLLVDEYSTMKDRKHVGLTINHASPTMSQT